MLKYILFSFTSFIYILFSYFINADVSISVDAPKQINAGEDFTMSVTITKGDIERFARFYQDLPIGCTATEGESQNAIFTFKDQQAKFIWMPGSLPAKETFTITYTIHVDETVSGNIIIPGQFVYIKNNERINIDIEPVEILVLNPNGENVIVQNINDTNQTYGLKSETVTTNREIQINGNVATITIKVEKPLMKDNFAKIEEVLPGNLQAIVDNDGGSLFSFNNHTVKFLWMNIPQGNELVVAYKVMKDDASDITMNDLKGITGSFSFLDGSETKNFAINTEGSDNTNLSDNLISENTNNANQQHNDSNPTKNIISDQLGVHYSVQICALMKKYRPPSFFNNRYYKIKDKIHIEEHQGWKKYTIGNFSVYKNARDYRTKIWNTTPVKDAFVAAYNKEKRITVQEALMIANQQWYQ
ncbi:MAG TPA: hypothetical protein EYP69_05445 [Bacteroidales bacterium]|nr:hypothetical protein [Bacteroidales bacterium]